MDDDLQAEIERLASLRDVPAPPVMNEEGRGVQAGAAPAPDDALRRVQAEAELLAGRCYELDPKGGYGLFVRDGRGLAHLESCGVDRRHHDLMTEEGVY